MQKKIRYVSIDIHISLLIIPSGLPEFSLNQSILIGAPPHLNANASKLIVLNANNQTQLIPVNAEVYKTDCLYVFTD